jgi:hypothetical protein
MSEFRAQRQGIAWCCLSAFGAIAVASGCAGTPPEDSASPDSSTATTTESSTTATPLSSAAPSSSSSSSAKSGSSRSVARDQFVAELAKAECESVTHCCTDAGAKHDALACEAHFHGREKWQLQIDSAKAYDPAVAAQCIDDIRSRSASACDLNVAEISSCGKMLGGTQPKGGPCETVFDCAFDPAGTTFCAKSDKGQGTCMLEVPGKAGAECVTPAYLPKNNLASQCSTDPTLRCDDKTHTCVSKVKDGEACKQNDDCNVASRCSGKCTPTLGVQCKRTVDCAANQHCSQGVCSASGKPGEACESNTDCFAPAMCNMATKKCSSPDAARFCTAP